MPIYRLEFQTQINTTPQTVYEHLRKPHNFLGLQPLLIQVEKVQYHDQNNIETVSYDTVEAFRWLGLVLYKNRIHVQTVFTKPPHQLQTIVHSFPNITLNADFIFTPHQQGTQITEVVQIQVPAWLAKFVTSQATQAQKALLANLKNRLESKIN